MNLFKTQKSAWVTTCVYVAAIFLTLEPVGSLQLWLKRHGWQTFTSDVLLIGAILAILYLIVVRLGRRSAIDLTTLAAAGVMYAYIMISFAPHPSDRIHLIEYSALAVALYYSLRFHISMKFVYVLSWAATTLIGLVDEVIQSRLPTRTYDLNDAMINAMAAGVALTVVGFVIEESGKS